MADHRFDIVNVPLNAEPLPGEFGVEFAQLDRELGEALRMVPAPSGLAGRVFAASAELLEPAAIPLRLHSPVFVLRQKRTMWARLAVAASLAAVCTLSMRAVMQSETTRTVNDDSAAIMQASTEEPLPHALELVLLDRTPNRMSEEVAYLFDPDPRESSTMSLFVQTREVTVDDLSDELAMLEAELSM